MRFKHFKLGLYKHAACYPLGYLVVFAIVTAASGFIIWQEGVPLRPDLDLPAGIAFLILAAVWLSLFLTGIFAWAWYFVWFRYLAYGVARIISLIRRLFKQIFFQVISVLALSTGIWLLRRYLYLGEEYDPREILTFSSLIKILVIAALLFTIVQIVKSRKRIFISDFGNYTGEATLDLAVKGIASMLANKMNRLSKLLRNIDEIEPSPAMEEVEPTLDIRDMGKDFEEIIGQGASVDIGKFKIPLKPVYAFFKKLVRGPILGGGVHLKGETLVLTACLKGGKFSGSWEIDTGDIETSPTHKSEQVIAMTAQLVCRIIAYISPHRGSPRWRAMSHYTEALRFYRETLLTIEKKKLNLIKAKNECSRALKDDSKFVQCYYNLGIIYNQLKSTDAARAAFRKALESAPDHYRCYYQLARLYYKEKNFFDARWFCEQALTICPAEADHWNLWAIIKYNNYKKRRKDNHKEDNNKIRLDIPGQVVQYFTNAAALAWQALCKAIIKGDNTQKFKETARICIRNLAVIRGMRKEWISRFSFRQALFLDPDNNDLLFELGKYYYRYYSDYRENKITKAFHAFRRVFEHDKEVGDTFSYWAFYLNVNARLYRKTKNAKKQEEAREYKEVVESGFRHFLDAAAEIIHDEKKYSDESIKRNEKLAAEELFRINNDEEGDTGFLTQLIDILNDFKSITGETDFDNADKRIGNDYLEKWSGKFSEDFSGLSDFFSRWVTVQAAVRLAKWEKNNSPENVKSKLKSLQNALKTKNKKEKEKEKEKENPDEIKTLELYRHLAEIYWKSNKPGKALQYARRCIRLAPYNWRIRELLGEIYFAVKDYHRAVSEWEISARLEELDPEQLFKILVKIGKAHKEAGKIALALEQRKPFFDKAVEFFTRALEILEDKAFGNNDEEKDTQYIYHVGEIHFHLGPLYRELAKHDEAVSHFRIAREMGYEGVQTMVDENRVDLF